MGETLSRRQVLVATASLALADRMNGSAADLGTLAWEQISVAGDVPAARWDHSMTASDSENLLLVFGGRDGSGIAMADTWSFSRTAITWSLLAIDGPSPRFGHAVATDQETGVAYLFGGQSADLFFNDLWAFDFADRTWSLVHDGSNSAPLPRYGTSMVWSNRGTLLVSHGFTSSGRFNDTWEFDPATAAWSDHSPADETTRPLNRCLHEAIWDESTESMLLYGGCSSGYGPCPQGDLWSFDLDGGVWSLLEPASAPPARSNPALVYDPGRRQALLVGGLTEAGYDSGAFRLTASDRSAWTAVEQGGTGPDPRASHDMCVTGPNLYLFGGYSVSGPTNDLWLARLDS